MICPDFNKLLGAHKPSPMLTAKLNGKSLAEQNLIHCVEYYQDCLRYL